MPGIDDLLKIEALAVLPGGVLSTRNFESKSQPDAATYSFPIQNVSLGVRMSNIVLLFRVLPGTTDPGAGGFMVENQDLANGGTASVPLTDVELLPLEPYVVTVHLTINQNAVKTTAGMYNLVVSATFDASPIIPEEPSPPPIGGGLLFVRVKPD